MIEIKDEYLGDGVYASWDGYNIWLDLRGQDARTKIALELNTINALIKYKENIMKELAANV